MKKYDLTTPQRNIWNLQRFYEKTSISNLCGAIFYEEKCCIENLKKALNKEIEVQDGLRLRFCYEGDTVKQYIYDYIYEDFTVLKFNSMDELDEYAHKRVVSPMNMIDSKMYSFEIFELNGTIGVLLCANHLISDAWSFSLLAKEVYEYYIAYSENKINEISAYSYIDFVNAEQEYLNSNRFKKDGRYWNDVYSSKPQISYMKTDMKPAVLPTIKRFTKVLEKDFANKIDAFYKNHKISQAVLFEAAVCIYMHKIKSEISDVNIGILIFNRNNLKEKSTVGMFVSTIPLKVTISENINAVNLCDDITSLHTQILRHQKYPYAKISENVHKRFDCTDNLYNVMVSFQNAKTDTNAYTKWYSNGYSEVPFSLHIDNRDDAGTYTINIDYQTEIFKSDEEIALIYERLIYVIEQILNEPERIISKISILTPAEYKKVIYDFNDTSVEYSHNKCVHELFSEQAAKCSDKVALVFEDKHFTYNQVDKMSNSLAHFLRQKGIQPNDIVPIIAKRSWHIIVAMFGILKAGGAYMPIDPSYPVDRIEFIINEASSKLALTSGFEKELSIDTIILDDFNYDLNQQEISNINSLNDLCYLIYTSGSTGQPKGTMLTHNTVRNYLNNNVNNVVCNRIIEDNRKNIVSVTNIVFDIFVTESILPIVNGLTIYFASDDEVFSQEKLADWITKNKIEIMQTTPTKMRGYLLDKNNLDYLSNLQIIILGGEALTSDLYLELKQHTNAEIYNIYGPAETTVWSTNAHIVSDDITIGKPISNTQIFILDQAKKPLPVGVAGELCISGSGVGKGYLNRPELTAEKFVPNPFADGTIMYCTGDLARWRTDGKIDYLGRIDTQVKIRGLRIELGEIESVMSSFEGINMVAATDKRDENNRQYLVGYYTSDDEIDEKSLRRHLSAKLPNYMIPNYFVRLAEIPMTASGKTDRKNLPQPDFVKQDSEYAEPETDTEIKLCNLMSQLFSLEHVSVTDDFFELGGDSLKAIEFIAKAHNLGIEIGLQDIFDYPNVRELCIFLVHRTGKKSLYTEEMFEKYKEILSKNVLDTNVIPTKKSLQNVFLTGATGFLGIHVLDCFMREESGKIYCLVRNDIERFKNILHYYFDSKYDNEWNSRIIPVIGDITDEKLYESLPTDVNTVIHTAATVKHYGVYRYFHEINVKGTQNMISYAERIRAKLIHISTISVSGNSLADVFTVYHSEDEKYFDEREIYIGQPIENVYIRSKFESEVSVLSAILNGLDAKIIRVGNLTNRTSDFLFQSNYTQNSFLTRIKAALEFGKIPEYLLPLYVEFSPVDETATGIIKIAQYADEQNIFHLNNNKPIYFDELLKVLEKLGINMDVVSGEIFNETIQEYAKNSATEYIYKAFQNDMDKDGRLVYDSNIRIVNDFTVQFLKQIGFEWTQIDFEYIKGYVEYFRNLGYLEV